MNLSFQKGRPYRVDLELTDEARRIFELDGPGTDPHGSIGHEYLKQHWARRFREDGYQVDLEAIRNRQDVGYGIDGRVDVTAPRGPESVAIEIETGKVGCRRGTSSRTSWQALRG